MILYGLISLMVLLWSGNFNVAKIALREFPPLLLMGLRVIVAAAIILPVLGDAFILLASLTFAMFTVMGKRSATRFDAVSRYWHRSWRCSGWVNR